MKIMTKIATIDVPQPIVEISPKGVSSIIELRFESFSSIGVELGRLAFRRVLGRSQAFERI